MILYIVRKINQQFLLIKHLLSSKKSSFNNPTINKKPNKIVK